MNNGSRASIAILYRLPGLSYASVAAVISAALLPATVQGEIYYYQVSKLSSYTQTAAVQPATADFWRFAGLLFYSADEVSSASIVFDVPPPTTVEMVQAGPNLHVYYSDAYGSLEDLDLAYPSTTYTFTVERGAGPESADVFLPDDLFSPEIPYFAGDTYDRLQSYDASQPFDLYVNGFTPPPGANNVQNTVQIAEAGVGLVLSVNMAPEETLVQIPADMLLPSTEYVFTIQYFCSVDTADGGFGTATSAATFIRDTNGSFTTLPLPPLPGDCNSDGGVDLLDYSGFAACLTGPGGGSGGSGCGCFDFDADADTDLRDFADFQNLFGLVDCPSGQMSCDGTCVNLDSNNANCGECGNTCAAGLACLSGLCAACPVGATLCGGTCVNTDFDNGHCGGCGHGCSSNEVCIAGACYPSEPCGPECGPP